MRFLILGGGPAGLTAAVRLIQKGISDFLLLEKESTAGGLCRSEQVDGSPLDIGGGHFLDVRRPAVDQFLFSFMPENEWDRYTRDSRIDMKGTLINHPIEANIWQMGLEDQVAYLKSIAVAGCNIGEPMPDEFVDWIYWKLGSRIANDYMIPYNRKMFSKELNQLGTYWLDKLPNVSFEETLLSCLTRKAYGQQPGHAAFYYPKKYGYGELWKRMADTITDHIEYNKTVIGIDFTNRTVTTLDGEHYHADMIITTIPWLELRDIVGMPDDIRNDIAQLRHSSIQIEYFPENIDTECQWIYCPNPELSYHRILVRHNFCPNSRGYWTETNGERIQNGESSSCYRYWNQYAYPLNTVRKPEIMRRLLAWSGAHNVIGLGRWGEHQHYNSDVTVELAMELMDRIA